MAAVLPSPDQETCWGTTIRATLAFLDARSTPDKRRAVINRLSQPSRAVITGTVLSSSHYPLRSLVELMEATDAELGRGDLALCWEIGKAAGDYEVNALHRVFLAIASLDFWFRIGGSMWRSYYSHGKMTNEEMGKTGGRAVLSEFNPISKAFCYRFGGWLWRICELAKKQHVSITHTECVLDGHPSCVWVGTWMS